MRVATVLLVCLLATAAPAGAQTLTASDSRVRAAIEHAATRVRLAGGTVADAQGIIVTDAHADPRSGLAYVYLRQSLDDIEIAGSEATVVVDAAGRPAYAAGVPVTEVLARVGPRAPALSAPDAIAAAAVAAGVATPPLMVTESGGGADRLVVYDVPEEALAPLTARLVYHAGEAGPIRLAWEVGPIEDERGPHAWMFRIDAVTGSELWRADLTDRDPIDPALLEPPGGPWREQAEWLFHARSGAAPDEYRVYPPPMEGPNEGERVLVVDPADALASPFGWHDTDGTAGAEFTLTRGNNVHSYLDTDNDGAPDVGLDVDGGPSLVFDFPLDLTQHPSTYRPAAVTNNFYWSNLIHDIAYHYGFTEAAGNFQVNNYGRGGLGNDDLRAEAQDGGGTNNANFSTPVEGQRPRMQMYLYTLTSPFRDGDLSNMTLVHEYTHGISNRLTGGPSVSGCLSNSEAMGEGWSDWLAAMLTMEAGDNRVTHRPYGTYPRGLDPNGPGLRPAALNTDFARNNYTYGHTRTGHPVNGPLAAPHGIGFVWSTIIWEAAWEMIDAYGFDPDFHNGDGTAGNQMMIRLVIEAMKLQPCRPGFVDGRDAIIAADQLLFAGAHVHELWTGFARRGLGVSATQGSSTTNSDNFEAFDLPFPPPQAGVTPAELSVNVPNGDVAYAMVEVSNLAAAGSQTLEVTAAIVDETPPAGPVPTSSSSARATQHFAVAPTSVSIEPGEDTTLTVTFNARQPPSGVHTATLRLMSNDPAGTIDVPLAMIAGGAVALDGGPGWRILSAPSAGLTVDSLAAQNLVEGLPDYYPAATPNLFTSYDGAAWVPPASGSHPLSPGRGFLWYFYDETFDPGGPSQSVALPMIIQAPVTTEESPTSVTVPLHADGDGLNLAGNPFRGPIDVSDLGAWASGGVLASAVGQVWDPISASWRLGTTEGQFAAWSGMVVENTSATALEIPSSAQSSDPLNAGGTRLLAFELEGAALTGQPLFDRAIALFFHPDALDGWDVWDATELAPLATAGVALAFEGVRDGNPVLKAQESRALSPEDPFDVTLDFAAVETGSTFTLRWPLLENFPDTWEFTLQDLVTGETTDLRLSSDYTFGATPLTPATDAGARAGLGGIPDVRAFAGGSARFILHVVPGVSTANSPGATPAEFALAAPAPNPAASHALVRFDVPAASHVRIELFDLLGRRVATVVDGSVQAGRHVARIDAGAIAAGVYVVRMRAGDFAAARRFVVGS